MFYILNKELYIGKEVTVGVRPEDVKIVNENEGLKAEVEVSELLGSNLNVYFSLNGEQYEQSILL